MAHSESVVIALPNDATAPGLARSFIVEHGVDLAGDVVADAELLVSELVTNALRHGEPEIRLWLCTHPPSLGVAVEDAGDSSRVAPQEPEADQCSGRGLKIVDAIATSWGVTANEPPPGKTVWFELGA